MKFDEAIRFAAHDSDYSYNLIDKEMKDAMYFYIIIKLVKDFNELSNFWLKLNYHLK